MSGHDQLNQRINRALRRLGKFRKATLYIELLTRYAFYRASRLFHNILFSPRARVHWLGRNHRPRRFERAFFILLVFGAMFLLEPRDYLLWSVMWGGALAIFINLHTIYVLIPRKRAHWVKQ